MTNLISAGELGAMRTVLNRSLPGTATILRRTLTADGQGGNTSAYAAVGTVSCRLSPRGRINSGGEATIADRTAATSERFITMAANTDVRTTDRVTVAAETFEVTTIHSPRSFELAVRVECVEIV